MSGNTDFGWIFEAIADSCQKLRRRIHDSKLVSFLMSAGQERALDFFHRLDKHQNSILSIREFIFGMMELRLPADITIKDVTKFAQAFDENGDGTISINEWSDFVKTPHYTPSKEDMAFDAIQIYSPETVVFSEGVPTRWFYNSEDGRLSFRHASAITWDNIQSRFTAHWASLPVQDRENHWGKNGRRFAILWHTSNSATTVSDTDSVKASELSFRDFAELRNRPSSQLKHVLALQTFIHTVSAGCAYRATFTRTAHGVESCRVRAERRVSVPDRRQPVLLAPPGDADTSSARGGGGLRSQSQESLLRHMTVEMAMSTEAKAVSTRLQLATRRLLGLIEREGAQRLERLELLFLVDDPNRWSMRLTLLRAPAVVFLPSEDEATLLQATAAAAAAAREGRKKLLSVGRTSAQASLERRCEGDFCAYLPLVFDSEDESVLSCLAWEPRATRTVSRAAVDRARREVASEPGGGRVALVAAVARAAGGRRRIDDGRIHVLELKIPAHGTIRGSVRFWALTAGTTTDGLFMSLVSPAGTTCVIERARARRGTKPQSPDSSPRRESAMHSAQTKDEATGPARGTVTGDESDPDDEDQPAKAEEAWQQKDKCIRHDLTFLDGEEVHGVWVLHVTDRGSRGGALAVWGIKCKVDRPTTPGFDLDPAGLQPNASFRSLPSVSSRVISTEPVRRVLDSPEPRPIHPHIAYLPRALPAHRYDVWRRPYRKERRGTAQWEVDTAVSDESEPETPDDGADQGFGRRMRAIARAAIIEAHSSEFARLRRMGRWSSRSSNRATPDHGIPAPKPMFSPSRYHGGYMYAYRKYMAYVEARIAPEDVEKLAQRDVILYGLREAEKNRRASRAFNSFHIVHDDFGAVAGGIDLHSPTAGRSSAFASRSSLMLRGGHNGGDNGGREALLASMAALDDDMNKAEASRATILMDALHFWKAHRPMVIGKAFSGWRAAAQGKGGKGISSMPLSKARVHRIRAQVRPQQPPGTEQSFTEEWTPCVEEEDETLIWAEKNGLLPVVRIPHRPDLSGAQRAVCVRCFQVYVRLDRLRDARARDCVRAARRARRWLSRSPVPGREDSNLGGKDSPLKIP